MINAQLVSLATKMYLLCAVVLIFSIMVSVRVWLFRFQVRKARDLFIIPQLDSKGLIFSRMEILTNAFFRGAKGDFEYGPPGFAFDVFDNTTFNRKVYCYVFYKKMKSAKDTGVEYRATAKIFLDSIPSVVKVEFKPEI
jgi:hypothetical protein